MNNIHQQKYLGAHHVMNIKNERHKLGWSAAVSCVTNRRERMVVHTREHNNAIHHEKNNYPIRNQHASLFPSHVSFYTLFN